MVFCNLLVWTKKFHVIFVERISQQIQREINTSRRFIARNNFSVNSAAKGTPRDLKCENIFVIRMTQLWWTAKFVVKHSRKPLWGRTWNVIPNIGPSSVTCVRSHLNARNHKWDILLLTAKLGPIIVYCVQRATISFRIWRTTTNVTMDVFTQQRKLLNNVER